MSLTAGTRLGPYEVVAPIGAGGMGEVVRARDTRLDREVAIKVLPESFAGDPDRRARFEHEARAIAALSHPNILAVYDTGVDDDRLFVVTELLEGDTLRERLSAALPVRKALDIAIQMSRGLSAAHVKGIVHRDLKPENVFLTRDGQVKILDFGLAKALEAEGSPDRADLSNSPTRSRHLTEAGVVLGTAAYMSPEQVRGQAVDARTDLFALGAVLYEMLTGRRAFQGDTAADTMFAVMKEEPPDPTSLRSDLPPALERIVRHCLEKSPTERFQTARDVAFALESLSGSGVAATLSAPHRPAADRASAWRAPLFAAAAAVVVTAAVFSLFGARLGLIRDADGDGAPLVLGALTPVTMEQGLEIDPSVSPDGSLVAYASGPPIRMRIFIRAVAGGPGRPLSADEAPYEFQPRWSPDGNEILYLTRTQVMRAPKLGGAARVVASDPDGFNAAAWSPDGTQILLASGGRLSVVQADSSERRELAQVSGELYTCDWAAAGGRIACAYGGLNFRPGGLFGNLAPSGILTAPAAGGAATPLVTPEHVNHSPVWSPDGRRLYFVSNRQGSMDIYAVPVSADGRAEAEPRRITTGLGAWWIDLTSDGRHLAYSTFVMRGNIWSLPIPSRETDTAGVTPVTRGNRLVEGMRVSPDQRWLVYDSTSHRNSDIFRIPLTGGEPAELTSDPADEFMADLAPDGREVVYHAFVSGSREIFVKPVDGGPARQITAAPSAQESFPRWAPDGRAIVYWDQGPDRVLTLLRRDSSGAWGAPESLRPGARQAGAWLRDGRLAYPRKGGVEVISIDTRQVQVVYAPSDVAADPRAEDVSSVDGRSLYFKSHDAEGRAAIWSVPSSGGRPTRLIRFLDTHSSSRSDFAAGAGRFFFRLEDHQADVWVADITVR